MSKRIEEVRKRKYIENVVNMIMEAQATVTKTARAVSLHTS